MVTLWRSGSRVAARVAEIGVLALVAYLPFLVSAPGRVSADSKQALYVDPQGFLAGAGYLWDPGAGAGTVPHQHIGYLWPMGPWFWVFDQLGVPDWIAQRLWLGTLTFLALLGARWLLRNLGAAPLLAAAGGLVYALTPYQLAFTARASVLLLPWVGLPWLVELTRRALHRGGWRHPALIALVVATVAGVNATSLALIAVGPVLVVAHHGLSGRSAARHSVSTAARIGVLSALASAWWIAGLRVQGAHGMPVLQVTENLAEVARWSMPNEVLRGLGNWFFGGEDQLGYSIDQAELYLDNPWFVGASLLVPLLALAAAVLVTGRARVLAVALIVTATVVSVGAWPYDQPSLVGRAFRWFAQETSLGLAFRNSHRIVPLLVLGMAIVVVAAVQRLPRDAHRRVGATAVAVAAIAGISPVFVHGYLSEHLDRPEDLPGEWTAAADHLDDRGVDETGNPSRVLEIPGSPFAAHRWGNTVEPVLPALIDRPHLAREVLPYGSVPTANLLDALDRRLQEGTFEPGALAPVARLFASSDVVVRSDLQFERFGVPDPWRLLSLLTDPEPSGLEVDATFGEPRVNRPAPDLAPIAEPHLRFEALRGVAPPLVRGPVPPITVLAVSDAPDLLSTWPAAEPIVLAGDGDGIVDAAASGLIDGRSLVLYADPLDETVLADALGHDAHLVLSDSNRRRIQTWFYAIRDTRGPTERAGETLVEPTGYDVRLDPFPHATDASRTVVEHLGGQVSANLTGGATRPEDRAIAAFDGDLGTAWRVGGPDPTGNRLSVELDDRVTLDRIDVVQPQDGPRDRVIESVRFHFDAGAPIDLTLDERSLEPDGQRIDLGLVDQVRRFEIEITGVSHPGFDPGLANAVGFADLRIPGVELRETVVLPRSLLERVGEASADHGLDVIMTRLRHDPTERGRVDTERRLDRSFDLPTTRTFALGGTARISPDAPDHVVDELLGTYPGDGGETTASSRLGGDIDARASAAFDGNPDTAWTAAFGPQVGQWIERRHPEPVRIDRVTMEVVNDELHSVPRQLELVVDGQVVAEHRLADLGEPGPPGSSQPVDFDIEPAVEGRAIRLVVTEVHRRSAPPADPAPMSTLPVAVSALDLGGSGPRTPTDRVETDCRDDLLEIDGRPVPVRVTGSANAVRTGLDVVVCHEELGEGDLALDEGRHRLVAAHGHRTGIDLDRLVLSSGPGGGAVGIDIRGAPAADSGAEVVAVDAGRTNWSATVESDGTPVWLVMGQSVSAGWSLEVVDEHTGAVVPVGERQLVNGYANGWLIAPESATTLSVALEWEPQQLVWGAFAVSIFAIGLCGGLVVGTRPRSIPIGRLIPLDREIAIGSRAPHSVVSLGTLAVAAVAVAMFTAAVSRPWIGALAGVVTALAARWAMARTVVAVLAPTALVGSFVFDEPALGWVSVGLVLAATVGHEAASRWEGVKDGPCPTKATAEPLR